MNFNQLKYIVSVDKHHNFSRAADECEIAQSTLSKEIQRLEKEFGIMIFDRSRFPVSTTMKGADLIEIALKILEEQKHFIETARKMNNRPEGIFRLGILPLLAPYL
ncbi:MAG: LysR family transcriptional regulator, partial [Chitinophagaceae bacterium]